MVVIGYFWWLLLVISGLFFFLLVFFFVLMERKVLGYSQSRVGPNKVSLMGVLQSLADFLKLFGKTGLLNNYYNSLGYRGLVYNLSLFMFVLSCFVFIGFFLNFNLLFLNSYLSFGWLIVFSSLCGYGFLLCGWGSNTKYSLFGAVRAAFSSITFEGVLMCLVLLIGLLLGNYGVGIYNLEFGFIILGGLLAYPIILVSILCECQRSPFDFSESESDLVSGFNTDYYGLSFAIIFACEYAIMVFFGWFISIVFWGLGFELWFFFIHTFFLIFVRAVFPRIRYDYFVSLMWKVVLLLMLLLVVSGLSFVYID